MSKIINCSIDVNLISKDKIKHHANGSAYWSFSVLEKRETDKFGNDFYVVEGQSKEEREAKAPKNYLKSSGKSYTFGDNGGTNAPVAANDYTKQDESNLPF